MITDTAKSIYRRVSTIATECLHTVFISALEEKYQDNWFNELLSQAKPATTPNSIYGILLADLLKVLSNESDVSSTIIEKADRTQGFSELVKKAYQTVSKINVSAPADHESAKYVDAANEIADVIDRFPAVRDEEGKTYISKILNSLSGSKKEDPIPTYSVVETIEKYKLNITEAEFVACCVEQDIPIAYDGAESVFKTKNFNAVKDFIAKYIAKKGNDNQKQNNRKLMMKIAAGALAVILIIITASITNSVNKASFNKKYNELLNSTSSTNMFDVLNNHIGVNGSNNTSSNNSVNNSSDISSVSGQAPSIHVGKNKRSYSINYVYDGDNYVARDASTEGEDVYTYLSSYIYDGSEYRDTQRVVFRISNQTDKILRNISYKFNILNEDGKAVVVHASKLTQNGNSVIIQPDDSYWEYADVPNAQVLLPGADLGFCTFVAEIYYDTVQ